MYKYTYWVDLKVLVLKINSNLELQSNMLKFQDSFKCKECAKIVNVYIEDYNDFDELTYEPHTYREKIMNKGVYIGHHFGKQAKLFIKDKNNIYFCSEDYNRILWSYIIKYVLTIFAIENNMLHLKAGLVEIGGKGILIVGRGGAGKTEMIKFLCSCGAKYISNTHVILSDNNIYGVKSNIRVRNGNSEKYVGFDEIMKSEISDKCDSISKILWIGHTVDGSMMIKELNEKQMFYNMKQFSEALATWELHEDVYDFYNSDPILISKKLSEIDEKIEKLISSSELYYVKGDIKNNDSSKKLWDFLTK